MLCLFLSVKGWETLPIYTAKEILEEMRCGYFFILICWRLCMSYVTLGNTGILEHIYKLRPLFLKENYQTTLLLTDQSIKKNPTNQRPTNTPKCCQVSK